MVTKLEDFVARLHADGIESGRAEAERLIGEAHARADAIVAEAEARAAEKLAEAAARVEAMFAQGESEVGLAARDAVLNLHSTLTASLEALLRYDVKAALDDPVVVTDLVKSVVLQYARADARGVRRIKVDVPEELRRPVEAALLRELARGTSGESTRIDVTGSLSEAGFEYRVGDGGTVEVTTEAVLDVLKSLMRPSLHRILNGTASTNGK
jgi:V/A-type H+/Na+-transporting ATPase subunit E